VISPINIIANADFATVIASPNGTNSVNGNVLSNDINSAGSSLTASLVAGPTSSQGDFILNADGTYKFTPAPGFSGPVIISYQACDGSTPPICATNTLEILVTKAALLVPDIAVTNIKVPFSGNLTVNDNVKKVKVSLDYHHFVPASDIAYFAIEISESETVDHFETLVQQIPINCGTGTENVYFERIRDGVNRKIIKSQIAPIPIECKGKWIQLKVRDSSGTQVEINKGYSRVNAMDACDRQRFGSANEITFYLPIQTPFQPLLSGTTNSYSTLKVGIPDGTNAVYIDYSADDVINAWTGPAQINVLLANCETNDANPYYYPGF
jgi:hypothetical protein